MKKSRIRENLKIDQPVKKSPTFYETVFITMLITAATGLYSETHESSQHPNILVLRTHLSLGSRHYSPLNAGEHPSEYMVIISQNLFLMLMRLRIP